MHYHPLTIAAAVCLATKPTQIHIPVCIPPHPTPAIHVLVFVRFGVFFLLLSAARQTKIPNGAWSNYLIETLRFSDWYLGIVNISSQVWVGEVGGVFVMRAHANHLVVFRKPEWGGGGTTGRAREPYVHPPVSRCWLVRFFVLARLSVLSALVEQFVFLSMRAAKSKKAPPA